MTDRYNKALSIAIYILRKNFRTKSIGNMEAHDFAMNIAMGTDDITRLTVYRDIIDAMRCNGFIAGDKNRKKNVTIGLTMPDRPASSNDDSVLDIEDVGFNAQQRKMAQMMIDGVPKKEIAEALGISRSRISQLTNEMADKIRKTPSWRSSLKAIYSRRDNEGRTTERNRKAVA